MKNDMQEKFDINDYELEDIVSCECIGEFEDEYVYDIEMSDETHTFMCNDILVHNSAYISLQPLIKTCKIPIEMETDFILAVNKFVLESYLDNAFEEYAKAFNCDKNLEKFELEKIARTVIMLAKKKYIMDISWKEPDVHVAPLHSVVYKGIEVIQGSTPVFAREHVKEFIKYMLGYLDDGKRPPYDEIISKIVDMKKKFVMQSPNDICKSFNIKDYDKYVLDDKSDYEIQYNPNVVVPMHIRAAAIYNHMLYNSAKKYKSKYNIIKPGDKVRFYYTNDKNEKGAYEPFGFIPNEFPIEFAPPMNIDKQFDDMILSPVNRIIVAAGYDEIPKTLTRPTALFDFDF